MTGFLLSKNMLKIQKKLGWFFWAQNQTVKEKLLRR